MTPEAAKARLTQCITEARELVDDERSSIRSWHGRTTSVLIAAFGPRHRFTDEFSMINFRGPSSGAPSSSPGFQDAVRRSNRNARFQGLATAVTLLETALFDIEINESTPTNSAKSPSGVFLVHGHDLRKSEVARALRQLTGEEPIILHEQPNRGRTIIEKFERHAGGSAYAVVLATGDDRGGEGASGDLQPRARQNVIFEMGFFVAALGRSRVAVLHDEAVELPSDYKGVLYIPLDSRGAWRHEIARELKDAGIPADTNNLT